MTDSARDEPGGPSKANPITWLLDPKANLERVESRIRIIGQLGTKCAGP